jgi:hypothetical protein
LQKFGFESFEDLFTPTLITDDELVADIGMSPSEARTFRTACRQGLLPTPAAPERSSGSYPLTYGGAVAPLLAEDERIATPEPEPVVGVAERTADTAPSPAAETAEESTASSSSSPQSQQITSEAIASKQNVLRALRKTAAATTGECCPLLSPQRQQYGSVGLHGVFTNKRKPTAERRAREGRCVLWLCCSFPCGFVVPRA